MSTATTSPPPSQPALAYPARSPWWFVPSLYFMQGLPVMVVQSMTVTMYKDLGLSNVQIAVWTSLITWPWIVKMLWGPMVDSMSTKRNWIVVCQTLILAVLALAALSLQLPGFVAVSLFAFFAMAFLSATHDIAADGFYMLSMNEQRQAFFVGIRSACFRLATIFSTGVLVVYAGNLRNAGVEAGVAWQRALLLGAVVYGTLLVWGAFALPKPPQDTTRRPAKALEILGAFMQILLMLVGLGLVSRLVYMAGGLIYSLISGSMSTFWTSFGTPLYLEELRFGENSRTVPIPIFAEYVISPVLIAAASYSTRHLFQRIGMGKTVTAFLSLNRIQAILAFILLYRFGESMIVKMSPPFLLEGNESGGLGLNVEAVGYITGTVGVLALVIGGLLGGFVIAAFGIKRCFWPMVLALNVPNLLYVWAAFTKPASAIADTILATKDLPLLDSIGPRLGAVFSDPVAAIIAVDQLGYGFGFAAYLVYLLFICQGTPLQTSLYAIATGLMALGAMIAGITSGFVQQWCAQIWPSESFGYFFIAACVLTIPGMLTLFFIPMDKEDLRSAPIEID